MHEWRPYAALVVVTTLAPLCCFAIHGATVRPEGMCVLPQQDPIVTTTGFRAKDSVFSIAISPDGNTIATGGHSIQLWDRISGERLSEVTRDAAVLERCAYLCFSPDGRNLVSIHEGMQVNSSAWSLTLWDVHSRFGRRLLNKSVLLSMQPNVVPLPGFVPSAVFTLDGHYLLAGSPDAIIHCWDVPKKTIRFRLPAGVAARFSQDGRSVHSVSQDGLLQRWDVASGKPLNQKERRREHYLYVQRVAFSPNGQQVAISDGHTILIMSLHKGLFECRLPLSGDDLIPDFSPDSKLVIVAQGNSLFLFDATTGEKLSSQVVAPGTITTFAVSSDGTLLLVVNEGSVLLTHLLQSYSRKLRPRPLPRPIPGCVSLNAKITIKQKVYSLDLGGKTTDAVSHMICSGQGGCVPKIPFSVRLHNFGNQQTIIMGKPIFTFYLVGPGAMNVPAPPRSVAPDLENRQSLTLLPGNDHLFHLAELKSSLVESYWLLPGRYTLHANCCLALSSATSERSDEGAGIEFVTLPCDPVSITVVSKEKPPRTHDHTEK